MRYIVDHFFENRKFYLTLAIILFMNIVFYLFFTSKEYMLYHNTEGEIEKVERDLKNTEIRYRDLNTILKDVIKVKDTIKHIKNRELKSIEGDFPQLTGKIYDILNRYNIEFKHISYTKKFLRGVNIIKVVIHIPVKTTYYNFRRCLNSLEEIPFPVYIERISVNSAEANSISATIDLVVYYRE